MIGEEEVDGACFTVGLCIWSLAFVDNVSRYHWRSAHAGNLLVCYDLVFCRHCRRHCTLY